MYSQSNNRWNYQIKNLIILDRIVEEKMFLWEICDLEIETLENFKDIDESNNQMLINILV